MVEQLIPQVAVAVGDPFGAGKLVATDGASGVKFIGADADYRSHAIVSATGQTGGGIDHDGGGIDPVGEVGYPVGAQGDDAVGVP